MKRYSFKSAEPDRVMRSIEQYAEVIPNWKDYQWPQLLDYGDLYVEQTAAIYVGASSTDPGTAGVLLLGLPTADHVRSAVIDALSRWSFRQAKVVVPDLLTFYLKAGFKAVELIDIESVPTIALELSAPNFDVGEEVDDQQSHNGDGRHPTIRPQMAGYVGRIWHAFRRWWRIRRS